MKLGVPATPHILEELGDDAQDHGQQNLRKEELLDVGHDF